MEISPDIVVLSGGSGGANLAQGLVENLGHRRQAIIGATWDNGGSTGLLRDRAPEAVGDLRRIIDAVGQADTTHLNTRFSSRDLSELDEAVAQFDQVVSVPGMAARQVGLTIDAAYRVGHEVNKASQRGIRGHTLGNFILAGLAQEQGILSAVRTLSIAVRAQADIYPAVIGPCCIEMDDGGVKIRGEHAIDTHSVQHPYDAYVYFREGVSPSSLAYQALSQARLVVAAPGSPYTSIAPGLRAFREALAEQQARGGLFAGVANLVNMPHDTGGWRVSDYARTHRNHARRPFDVILHNSNYQDLPDAARNRAVQRHEPDEGEGSPQVISSNFVGHATVKDANDSAVRTEVTHDKRALAEALEEILLTSGTTPRRATISVSS